MNIINSASQKKDAPNIENKYDNKNSLLILAFSSLLIVNMRLIMQYNAKIHEITNALLAVISTKNKINPNRVKNVSEMKENTI